MTEIEFCRWLQGFCELAKARPTEAQWKSIREHLQTVYAKVTPPVASTTTFTLPSLPSGPVRIC